MDDHVDVMVNGSGPCGAPLAHRLAPTGKKILILERGGCLPRSRVNWDAQTVLVEGHHPTPETCYGSDASEFQAGLHGYVGGNSKVYGAAHLKVRERDFGEIAHKDGASLAWPPPYEAFERYYAEAALSKADCQVMGVDPTLRAYPNFTPLTDAYASTPDTDERGAGVSAGNVTRAGRAERFTSDIVVAACGALSSALLLRRSANDKHPHGLCNGSDHVGPNYMPIGRTRRKTTTSPTAAAFHRSGRSIRR